MSRFINLTYDEELAIRWCKPTQDSQSFNRMYEAMTISKLALFLHISELVEDCTDYGYFNYVVSEENDKNIEKCENEEEHFDEKCENEEVAINKDMEIKKYNGVLLGENDEYSLGQVGEFETDIPF